MSDYNNIQLTEKPDSQKWEAFIASHPQRNIFQSPAMFGLYGRIANYYPGVIAATDERGEIKAILLYNIISEPGIMRQLSGRSIITGGPLAHNDDPYYISLLLEYYRRLIKKYRVIYTQIRNLSDTAWLKAVAKKHRFQYDHHLTIHIDLTQGVDRLKEGMHKKRFSNIKRAYKKNVIVRSIRSEIELTEACALIQKTYDRINVPSPPPGLFLNAFQMLGDRIRFMAAYTEDRMIACRIYLLYNSIMYDWYAGSDLSYTHLCPNDILPWEAMLWGKENQIHTYDFAGAGKPGKPYGVRDYKLKFGGSLYDFGRYECVHKPVLFEIGKIGMKLFKYFNTLL